MLLNAIYEQDFLDVSSGYRAGNRAKDAVGDLRFQVQYGTFGDVVEADIQGSFDNISHKTLMRILKRNIKDKEFHKLIWGMLKAGYMEKWIYHKTYSGTPQGGIVNPLLANIVLNELDEFVEDILIPQNTYGKKRKWNPEYRKLAKQAERAKKRGDWRLASRLRRKYTQLPRVMTDDPDFRRLWYVRYADDFLLGYMGTKQEVEAIKLEIGDFLETIQLEMSEKKTLITHARTGKAKFLNYEINATNSNSKRTNRKRSVNQML